MRIKQGALAGLAAVLAAASIVMTVNNDANEQARITAAQQLASPSAESSHEPSPTAVATTSAPSISPSAIPTVPAVPPPAVAVAPPAPPAIVYPITKFSWPDAGINVTIVTMNRDLWQSQTDGVDPPLDKYNYDPVGHWLEGTGPSGDGQVINQWQRLVALQLAGHTCFVTSDPLCNDKTFPFNRLSYDGWAVGQYATITDNAGHAFDMTLVRRDIVPKSGFGIDTNPCDVQVFTCNKQDPHNSATLVTFKRAQCTP